jgi:hypothetical protein
MEERNWVNQGEDGESFGDVTVKLVYVGHVCFHSNVASLYRWPTCSKIMLEFSIFVFIVTTSFCIRNLNVHYAASLETSGGGY